MRLNFLCEFGILVSVVSLLTVTLNYVRPAKSAELQQYDWVVLVETKKLKNQFDYTNSHLKKVAKCEISYWYVGDDPHDADHPDESHKIKYEDFWFSERRPLGLERHHRFALDQADGISIKVRHKDGGESDVEEEAQAAADTILRLQLDAAKNHNPVADIRLPDGQPYDSILDELRHKGFMDADHQSENQPLDSSLTMFFKEENGSRTHTLYYN